MTKEVAYIRRRLTLSLATLTWVSLLLLAAVLFFGVRALNDLSQDSVAEASQLILDASSSDVEDDCHDFLEPCKTILTNFQSEIRLGTMTSSDFERRFFVLLHTHPRVSELTFTSGKLLKATRDGVQTEPGSVRQMTVFRSPDGHLVSRHVEPRPLGAEAKTGRSAGWDVRERLRDKDEAFGGGPDSPEGPRWQIVERGAPDPSRHASFQIPAGQSLTGELEPFWSDLSYSQVDAERPEAQRRVELTIQGAVVDQQKHFLGVLRIGLLTRELDHCFDSLNELSAVGDHYYFLCDADGQLVTPVLSAHPTGDPKVVRRGEHLRIDQPLPEPVRLALLARPLSQSVPIQCNGRTYLARLRSLNLQGAQHWRVGLVVADEGLVGALPYRRRELLYSAMITTCLAALVGLLIMEGVRRQLGQLSRTALAMKGFQFDPLLHRSWLSEVADVAESLETAKGTLRAMICYVPVELVRQLFQARLKPVLTSHAQVVCLMFTDIEGFTTTAERLSPDELAGCLGRYLEHMNASIQINHGTILERVGDALLAIWNAPKPLENGEVWACRAALACVKAIAALDEAEILKTRFGIHRDTVLVGHFGSKDRMNYGVLGDGVNFASRLEGLNKQYGTSILVSAPLAAELGEEMVLRKLDLVAVKGKQQGILIFELVGLKGEVEPERLEALHIYEQAWKLYQQQKFVEAASLLESQLETDAPSQILRDRCLRWSDAPPANWDGAYRASEK